MSDWSQSCTGQDPHNRNGQSFFSKQVEATKAPLQSNDNIIIGWLAGAHIPTFNCQEFNHVLQTHPKFEYLPIEV